MKIIKIFLTICLFGTTLLPLQAKVNTSVLVVSKQLPYIMYIDIPDEKHMNVYFISRDMMLPTNCRNEVTPLKKLDLRTELSCVKQSIESFFHKKSSHYVYVHLNRIAETLKLSYKNIDFTKLSNLCDYFGNVVQHLKFSMLLHYQNYIESDFSLSDYYDFYHMFKGKSVAISYHYVNQLYVGSYTLPMDHNFVKKK